MNEESMKELLNKEGYSSEEKYFYELNRELIKTQRVQLDLIRKNSNEKLCPKCNANLYESEEGGFTHLQCISCKGVFMESKELEALMNTNKTDRFVMKMKKLFIPREDYQLF
jgi:Zn-finger nucleic acid-binding protein